MLSLIKLIKKHDWKKIKEEERGLSWKTFPQYKCRKCGTEVYQYKSQLPKRGCEY